MVYRKTKTPGAPSRAKTKITRIMIDGGSAVNLLSLRMLKRLGIAIHRLAPINILIQGFHQSRQRFLGIV